MSKRNGESGRAGFAVLITLTVVIIAAAVAVGLRMIASRGGDGGIGGADRTDSVQTTSAKNIETEPPAPAKFTVNMQPGSENAGTLVLVNATHAYSFPEDEQLVNLYEEGMGEHVKLASSDIRLRPEAMNALRDLSDAFYEQSGSRELLIASGYRSYDEQVEIYSSRVDSKGIDYAKKYVAMPGCSEHHTGLCFDLSVYTDEGIAMHLDDSEDYAYVIEHCADFGLVRRYDESKTAITGISGEDWHFRYVGVTHALYMTEKELCLEEYLELLQKHTALNPLELTTSDTKYTMYFVTAAPAGATGIEIGEEYSETYSISGTACGGYAVSYSEPYTPPETDAADGAVSESGSGIAAGNNAGGAAQ